MLEKQQIGSVPDMCLNVELWTQPRSISTTTPSNLQITTNGCRGLENLFQYSYSIGSSYRVHVCVRVTFVIINKHIGIV